MTGSTLRSPASTKARAGTQREIMALWNGGMWSDFRVAFRVAS